MSSTKNAFKAAADAATVPAPKPAPSKRSTNRGGTDSRSFSALAIVENYVKLCRDPASDLMAWLREFDACPVVADTIRSTSTKGTNEQTTFRGARSHLENSAGIRGHPLHALRDGLDAYGRTRSAHRLPTGPPTGPFRYDTLRPLQAAEGSHLGSTGPPPTRAPPQARANTASELGAIDAAFAGRRAAILLTARPGDVPALLRALAGEQVVARQAILDRQAASVRSSAASSFAERPPILRAGGMRDGSTGNSSP